MMKIKQIGYITLFLLIFPVNALFGQKSPDGIWKSIYELESYPDDSLIRYTRILLMIEGKNATILNYDRAMGEKNIFSNTFTLNQEDQSLIFDSASSEPKEYKFEFNNDNFDIIFNHKPLRIIRFKKLEEFTLGYQEENLKDFLVNNTIKGTFTYYDEELQLEFYANNNMWVTNSLKSYLIPLNKWFTYNVGNELFIYLSDFGPMVQVTDISTERIDFIDEYDQKYTGHFIKVEPETEFDKKGLTGVWEQETPDTTGIGLIPQKMRDRDFYLKEVWEFEEKKATKYHRFFVRETDWETSRNGELIILISIEDQRFRILSLDDKKLVVERSDYYGKVYQDTFIKKKSVPSPKPLNKFN